MDKRLIKKLVLASYSNKILDGKKVNKIVKLLTRAELKMYIKRLKIVEKEKTVIIVLPKISSKKATKEFQSIFPGKQVLLKEDRNLIAGIKIIDNDQVYESNIKNNLNNIISYISQ